MPHQDQDLFELTITQALEGLASRRFSAREYAQSLIGRCEDCASLNALVSHDWTRLLDAADAVDASGTAGQNLGGIPLCIKDNISTAILPAGAATGALANHIAKAPAAVAKALFDAGALLGASGNMHELAFGISSNNGVTGAVHNPWNPAMIPGGSSGGVAAAVAARMMPGGIGTDTGASVRLPASLCGLVGFRPTVGRYPGDGIVPISHTRDTAGPITRSVADAQLLDRVMAGQTNEVATTTLSGLRLGVPRGYFFDGLDPAVAANAEASLEALRKAGVTLIEADIPDIGSLNGAVSFTVVLYEFMQDLPRYLRDNGLDLSMQDILDGIGSPDVKGLVASLLGSGAMPEEVYRKAISEDRPKLQATYAEYFKSHGVEAVIFPTAPLPARPIGDDETVELNGERVPTFPTFIRNTDPGSNAAIPGISIPVALSSTGLPIGMELDGPENSDSHLLDVAEMLEDIAALSSKPNL